LTLIGIDLGTTNSAVAVWTEAGPRLIANAIGENLTPSVVGLDDDNSILVGQSARNRLVTHPERTVASFKRWMGTTRETRLGRGQVFRPEELSAFVLPAASRRQVQPRRGRERARDFHARRGGVRLAAR
jgi:molecular chaperone HscC